MSALHLFRHAYGGQLASPRVRRQTAYSDDPHLCRRMRAGHKAGYLPPREMRTRRQSRCGSRHSVSLNVSRKHFFFVPLRDCPVWRFLAGRWRNLSMRDLTSFSFASQTFPHPPPSPPPFLPRHEDGSDTLHILRPLSSSLIILIADAFL